MDSTPPLAIADVISTLTPSRAIQVAQKVGLESPPNDSTAKGAQACEVPLKTVLSALYRGELQKLCDMRGVSRAGAVYDHDLVEKLLG
jgi:hypothetical protein